MLKYSNDIYSVKLIDFGLSVQITKYYFTEASGTMSFLSPEIINRSYTELCDIWAFGVSLYKMLTGYNPFKVDKNDSKTIDNIKKMELPLN